MQAYGPQNGIFLVRDSTSALNSFVLSVTHDSKVYQFQIKEVYDGHYRLDQGPIVHGMYNKKLISVIKESISGL